MPTPAKGYEIKFPDVGKVSKSLVAELMPAMVHVVAVKAADKAPRRTGKLANSIEERVEEDGARGAVAATARHAHLVHEGTAAHPIVAKHSKALTVFSGGVALRKSAQHPGSKAQPFLRDALEESGGALADALRGGGEASLKRAIGG